jgi:hypothetical protein
VQNPSTKNHIFHFTGSLIFSRYCSSLRHRKMSSEGVLKASYFENIEDEAKYWKNL